MRITAFLKQFLESFFRAPARIFFWLNLIFIIGVFIIGFRPNAFRPKITEYDLAYYNGHRLTLTGRICEEADVDYKSRRLNLCLKGKINGQVLVSTNLYPIYDYGDWLEISGGLQVPPKIEGFDYESYLARYDVYSVMYYPKITKLNNPPVLSLSESSYRFLIKFKQRLRLIIDSALPEPEAGLADALLLGYRRTVGREDLNIFARVGLSHMIAISGSHITILSAMIINFFLVLGFSRRRAIIIVFGFLFLYPLITGLAASAVRSAIMGALAFLALYYGRPSSLLKALVFSGALMLAFNPRLLRDDIGFQLSFLALLGIIYIYPIGERIARRALDKMKLKNKNILKTILDTINLTLVSQIVILPIALINFKQLSLIAPLANVLVLWTFPPLLASLIIGTLAAALIPALQVFWFLPSYFLLKYIFIVSGLLATPSWAAVSITWFNWYWGGAYYGLLLVFIKIFNGRKSLLIKKK